MAGDYVTYNNTWEYASTGYAGQVSYSTGTNMVQRATRAAHVLTPQEREWLQEARRQADSQTCYAALAYIPPTMDAILQADIVKAIVGCPGQPSEWDVRKAVILQYMKKGGRKMNPETEKAFVEVMVIRQKIAMAKEYGLDTKADEEWLAKADRDLKCKIAAEKDAVKTALKKKIEELRTREEKRKDLEAELAKLEEESK